MIHTGDAVRERWGDRRTGVVEAITYWPGAECSVKGIRRDGRVTHWPALESDLEVLAGDEADAVLDALRDVTSTGG